MKKLILTMIFCLVWSVASAGMMDNLAAVAKKRVAPGGGIFSSDTFTGETNGTLLTAHTGEVGATWTVITGHTSPVCYTPGIIYNASATPGAYSSGTPDSSDYTVSADIIRQNSGGALIGVAGRISTSAQTCYVAWYQVSTTSWVLGKYVATNYTTLNTYTQTLTQDQAYRVTLDMSGTTIRLLVDDVQRISESDSDISAAGRAGVSGLGDNSALLLDNFEASN